MSKLKITTAVEDVGGSFRRLVTQLPRDARSYIHDAVEKTAFSMAGRMRHLAPTGTDAPHIREAITYKRRGQRAEIGVLNSAGGADPAAPGSTASMADVALYNEYHPNQQPFMRPAAEAENDDFTKRVTTAVQQAVKAFEVGGGL